MRTLVHTCFLLSLTHLQSYEILSSTETRQRYDSYGIDGISGGGRGGPDIDPADLLSELFGGGFHFGFDFGPGGGRKRTRGEDSIIKNEVTLEDLYNGKSIKMNMEKEVVCAACKG